MWSTLAGSQATAGFHPPDPRRMNGSMITLPNGMRLSEARARTTFSSYVQDHAAVLDLYDGTNPGPHDAVLPVDLLALNALNAYVGSAPMTPMSELWYAAGDVNQAVARVTKRELSDLSDGELPSVVTSIVDAITAVEQVRGYRTGGTRAAKLLHRLRPDVVPIWDVLVGEWYGGARRTWCDYIRAVFRDVRRGPNQRCLQRLPVPERPRLSLLRRWDILLWKLKYDERAAQQPAQSDVVPPPFGRSEPRR